MTLKVQKVRGKISFRSSSYPISLNFPFLSFPITVTFPSPFLCLFSFPCCPYPLPISSSFLGLNLHFIPFLTPILLDSPFPSLPTSLLFPFPVPPFLSTFPSPFPSFHFPLLLSSFLFPLPHSFFLFIFFSSSFPSPLRFCCSLPYLPSPFLPPLPFLLSHFPFPFFISPFLSPFILSFYLSFLISFLTPVSRFFFSLTSLIQEGARNPFSPSTMYIFLCKLCLLKLNCLLSANPFNLKQTKKK